MTAGSTWALQREKLFSQFFRTRHDIADSFRFARQVCSVHDDLVARAATIAGIRALDGVCLCAFGSPARFEMLGASDVDCLIVRPDGIDVSTFRNSLIEALTSFGFSKLDIPEWGSLVDCDAFLSTAITEGNQVVEARFLAGDRRTWNTLAAIQNRHCTTERFATTFLFQYHYFNQYYRQRERRGQRNIKYGHGGTRDFLFPVWLAYFRDGFRSMHRRDTAHILAALDSLASHGDTSNSSPALRVRAVNVVAFLRDRLLQYSEGTPDAGLTYLHPGSAQVLANELPDLFVSRDEVLSDGLSACEVVRQLKEECYSAFVHHPSVKQRLTTNDPADSLSAIQIAWFRDLAALTTEVVDALLDGSRWAVLASLGCNPTCPPDLLDELAHRSTKRGYEYILKVVGRNPRTGVDTLKRIATSPVEWRFREPAVTRMRQGWRRANEL